MDDLVESLIRLMNGWARRLDHQRYPWRIHDPPAGLARVLTDQPRAAANRTTAPCQRSLQRQPVISLVHLELGLQPKVPLEQGLETSNAWFTNLF